MSNQDNYFKANILNMIQNVRGAKYSNFLTPQEQIQAVEILNNYKFDNYLFFGGNDDCERTILGVFDDYITPQISELSELSEFSICCIKIQPTDKNITNISHRDYLGSIMGLQLERDVIGDIFCFDDYGVVFIKDNLKEFVLSNLDKVGKTRVKLSIIDGLELKNTKKFMLIKGTVSSLRLDCIVAFLINKSRSDATKTINSGIVTVNYSVVTNVSKTLKIGDVIVIRGKGKFVLDDDIKQTKKDRLFITVKKSQ